MRICFLAFPASGVHQHSFSPDSFLHFQSTLPQPCFCRYTSSLTLTLLPSYIMDCLLNARPPKCWVYDVDGRLISGQQTLHMGWKDNKKCRGEHIYPLHLDVIFL